ncbi:MAG: TonB-dependent receptor [Tannerella sp.]|jgi:TonB-linked SusC/RagA family outer membrane protein|nr:TonB-dependent receptor [Tannerella sp.]
MMVCVLLGAGLWAAAQTVTVTGTVTDPAGETLPGVSIRIEGTATGTITDMDGAYTVNVPGAQSVLQFNYVGYVPKNVTVGNQRVIDVVMEDDVAQLEEVVVVGYGVVKKSDVTGAMVRIGENELKSMPVQNPLQAMQGKMAGVDITSNDRPGEVGKIRIRGERSMNATNDPLYVVDGIPLQGLGIENLNPNDIESVDVLKDASATAIYGSRGANGVVMVTTKRGQSGRMSLNYSGSYSVDNLVDRMEMMNSAEWLEYSRRAKSWGKEYVLSKEQDLAWFGGDPYAWSNVEKGWAGGSWDGSQAPSYDWTSHGMQTGITQEHGLSASGGTDRIQAYVSFGYLNQQGTQPGQGYERYTGKATVDLQATDWFKVGGSINVTFGDQDYGYDFRKSVTGADNLYGALKGMLPYAVPYTPEGEYIRNPGADVNIINPIREVALLENQRQNLRALGNFYGELNVGKIYGQLDGLKYRIQFGPDFRYGRTGMMDDTESINGDGHNVAQYNTEIKRSWTLDNLVYYDKMFGKHSIGATLLQSASAYHFEEAKMRSYVSSFKELWYNTGSASNIQSYGSDMTETQLASYMARLSYGFDQRYLLTVSGRWDGASQLAEGHKWDFFPSAALAWRLDQEAFMQDIDWIDQLKPRLGFGTTGNSAISAYATMGAVSSNFYHFGSTTVVGMIGSDPSAATPVTMANNQLGWEKTTQYNLGIDFSLFKGRISGMIDLYTSTTSDLLMKQRIPSLTGYTTTWANVGAVKNKGIDITLNTVNVQAHDFVWQSSITFMADRNEITELANGADEDLTDGDNIRIVGQSLGVHYDYVYDGVWKTGEATEAAKYGRLPGELKIKDLSGPDGIPDGVIDANYDKQVVGYKRPNWSGGFQNTFTYKNFELSCFLFGRFGFDIATGAESLSGRFAMRKLDYWVAGSNEDAKYYAPGVNGESGDTYRSSMNYQDGSFIKIKNISLGYYFPSRMLGKTKISNLKLYVQCINPGLLYSKIDYLDPDLYIDSNMTGTSYNRSFVFGLNIGF